MKKIAIFALCFVLGIGLLTACGRKSSADETADPSTGASSIITTPTTAATKPTTAPTTPSSSGMMEDGVIDGNGDAAGKSGRIRRMD